MYAESNRSELVKLKAASLFVSVNENELHMIGKRGHFVLRGRNVEKLHSALLPVLQRGVPFDELLHSVPHRYRSVLEKYLDHLRGGGLLAEPALERSVSLVRPVQASEALLDIQKQFDSNRTLVCGDWMDTDDAHQIYSWLKSAPHSDATNAFRVYSLERETYPPQLKLVLSLRSLEECSQIPEQLRIVKFANVSQVPLVVLVAQHALFASGTISVGLRFPDTYDAALIGFLSDIAPLDARSRRWKSFGTDRILGPRAASMTTDRRIHLTMALLEKHASACIALGKETAHVRTTCRLDSVRSEHPDLRYLSTVLRLANCDASADVVQFRNGLSVFSWNGISTASFFRKKALRDLMLAAVAKSYYPGHGRVAVAAAKPRYDFSDFGSARELRSAIATYRSYCTANQYAVSVDYRKASCWGRSYWQGVVDDRLQD
jgi:hypothetical protein